MGVIKRGLLGGFSGRVGNIVGSSWKGIAIIKSLPLSVANPKTAAQVAHRQDFADTVAFAKKCLAQVVKPFWDRFASKQSGFNAFVQTNIKLLQTSIGGKYSKFILSSGKMIAPVISNVSTSVEDDDVAIDYPTNPTGPLEQSTDLMTGIAMINDDVSTLSFSEPTLRSAGTVGLLLPQVPTQDDVLNVWLIAQRNDGTIVSATAFTSTDYQ